jgi:hypothetical protein
LVGGIAGYGGAEVPELLNLTRGCGELLLQVTTMSVGLPVRARNAALTGCSFGGDLFPALALLAVLPDECWNDWRSQDYFRMFIQRCHLCYLLRCRRTVGHKRRSDSNQLLELLHRKLYRNYL